MSIDRFRHDQYTFRRKVLTLVGAKVHVFDPDNQLVMFSKLKAFKLKEDIRLYADESMAEELLTIQARNVIDFSAAYDVVDPKTNEHIGTIRRKGLKSMVRDEWELLDHEDQLLAVIQEDSTWMALLRRFVDLVTLVFPQKYTMTSDGLPLGSFKQNYNPFVTKIAVDFTDDREKLLDRRLGLAAGILLCVIEGKQS